MARRRANKGKSKGKGKGRNKGQMPLLIGAAVLALIVAAFFLIKPAGSTKKEVVSDFSISEYRAKGGSTYIGNRYTLEGKVENIISLGNDRLVSVSLRNNNRERLPLLVKGGSAVNLSRGDTFLFEVECVTGQDAAGQPVKGIMVVKNVNIQ